MLLEEKSNENNGKMQELHGTAIAGGKEVTSSWTHEGQKHTIGDRRKKKKQKTYNKHSMHAPHRHNLRMTMKRKVYEYFFFSQPLYE